MSWISDVDPEWPDTMQNDTIPDEFILDDQEPFSGEIKNVPEDYQVTEILDQDPTGAGPNTFMRIKKRKISTPAVIQVLADFLDRDPEDFCVADYKDRQAVAIQWISLEHLDPRALKNFKHDNIEIIQITRHEEKLKQVDLEGNRFEITVRNPGADAAELSETGFGVLDNRGVPNWFGNQSFGPNRNYHLMGWAIIKKKWDWFLRELLARPEREENDRLIAARESAAQGDWERAQQRFPDDREAEHAVLESLQRYPDNHERAVEVIPEDYRQYYLRALQAYAFNRFLTNRTDNFDELIEGDVAYMHESAGCFPVMDPDDEQPRLERFEISPTGPLYGEKFLGASEQIGELEDGNLEELDLSYDDFQRSRYPVQGRRRPLRAPVRQVRVQEIEDGDLELGFFLPRGSYATSVLEEFMGTRLQFSEEDI